MCTSTVFAVCWAGRCHAKEVNFQGRLRVREVGKRYVWWSGGEEAHSEALAHADDKDTRNSFIHASIPARSPWWFRSSASFTVRLDHREFGTSEYMRNVGWDQLTEEGRRAVNR